MEFNTALTIIYLSCVAGIIWAIINWVMVSRVKVLKVADELEQGLASENKKLDVLVEIGRKISDV